MQPHYWTTEDYHHDNSVTMSEYLNGIMDEEWSIICHDGTYAEVELPSGDKFEVHASGNGDSFNHKIEFVEIETT